MINLDQKGCGMKIEQEQNFVPITITLESKEEAGMFWELICYGSSKRQGKLKDFANKISNWFSNSAQV